VNEHIIEVSDVSVGWSPETILVEHASFEIDRGEVFAILGGSGSGKSTLLRHMIGLEPPLAGNVTIMGVDHPNLEVGRPRFGVMFQGGALFGSMTVLENVMLPLQEWIDLPADAATAMARAKLRLVGLAGTGDKMPSELSGGMRKRAAIARAMVLEPTLLFLDEPSAGLDPITSADLDDLIVTLKAVMGLTLVVVTHELASIFAIADRCILLDKETKSIIARGPPLELQHSSDQRVSDFFNRRGRAA
jgi:phospholipid/cholesterol/gamma-HCH transport system ATP-binding protein